MIDFKSRSPFFSIFFPFSSLFRIDTLLNIGNKMILYSGYSLLQILAKTKYVVTFITFIIMITVQSMHFNYFVTGSCFTAFIAKVLKRYWKQPRPYGQKGYGMPSTHSQVIMYFATYTFNVGYQTMPWIVTLIGCFALAVVWSRVQLKHHTLAQVAVGSFIGIMMAMAWCQAWSTIEPYLDELYLMYFVNNNITISLKQ